MGRNDVVTVLDPRGQPSGIFGRRADAGDPAAILNPRVRPSSDLAALESLQMAERLDSLEGKKVFLLDTGFAGSTDFLEEVAGWFSRNMPAVKTEYRKKQGNMYCDDPALWAEVSEKGDAAIIGVGG